MKVGELKALLEAFDDNMTVDILVTDITYRDLDLVLQVDSVEQMHELDNESNQTCTLCAEYEPHHCPEPVYTKDHDELEGIDMFGGKESPVATPNTDEGKED